MIIDCLVKAILLFAIYNIVAVRLFGIPESISMTYYLFKAKSEKLKHLFTIMIVMMCMFLTPCLMVLSENSNFQFLSLLSSASLIFIGVAPAFNSNRLENKVHIYSAYFCALFAMMWVILITPYWYIILIVSIIVVILATITNSIKTAYIYWLEIIAFVSTFISILLYYINIK